MAGDPDAELLGYYLKEIDYLRTAGAGFAKKHPHLAAGLDLRAWPNEDPQIARLLESFAFLTAGLRRRFDAQFPEIPTGLLETLYPQLVAPVPSMAIAQFKTRPSQARAIEDLVVPRETSLYAVTASGAECRFRTGYDLALLPLEVAQARLQAPGDLSWDVRADAELCLRVRLTCQGVQTFEGFGSRPLRFFIDGVRSTRFKIYELLCNRLLGVAAEYRSADGATITHTLLDTARVRPCGLELEDGMLPYPANVHHGYRLLQEFFAFPDKFLFVELSGVQPGQLGSGQDVDLVFLLGEEPVEPLMVDGNTLRLGCVPIINLFPRVSEPIRLDHLSLEYRLEGDVRHAGVTEIHSVDRITRSSSPSEAGDDVIPYYSYAGGRAGDRARAPRWIARRQRASNPMLSGSEIWLSFVDAALDPMKPAEDVLFAQTLCTNRGLARQLPSRTPLQLDSGLDVGQIFCLARPTAQADAPLSGESLWQLVSHLSLNTLSLSHGQESLAALKAILGLYSGADDAHREMKQINGLETLETRKIVRAVSGANGRQFVRGLEIELKFREEEHVGRGDYLLASILERFLALYSGVNSFTRLIIKRRQGEEVWKRWPPRAGERFVL